MSEIREHIDATTRLIERAGALKGSIVLWDLSEGPKNNTDRIAKLGRGDATHGLAFGRGFNTKTNAAMILDGVPTSAQPDKADISAFRMFEPDNWVLRLHSRRGRETYDNCWAIRRISDHTNAANSLRNRGTMVIDQCPDQAWGYESDLTWVINIGAAASDPEIQFDDAGFLAMLYEKGSGPGDASGAPPGGDVLGDMPGPTLQEVLGDIGGGGVAGGAGGGAGGPAGDGFGQNAFQSDGQGGVHGGTGGGAGGANGRGVTPGSTVAAPRVTGRGKGARAAVGLNMGKRGAYLTDGVKVGQGWHIWHLSELVGPPVPRGSAPGPGPIGSTVAEESLNSTPGSTVSTPEAHGGGGGGAGCGPVKIWHATLRGDVNWDFRGVLGHLTLLDPPSYPKDNDGDVIRCHAFLDVPGAVPPKVELADDPSSDQPVLPRIHQKGIRYWTRLPSALSSSALSVTITGHVRSEMGSNSPGMPPKHQYPPTIPGSTGGGNQFPTTPYNPPTGSVPVDPPGAIGDAKKNLGDDPPVPDTKTGGAPQQPPEGVPQADTWAPKNDYGGDSPVQAEPGTVFIPDAVP